MLDAPKTPLDAPKTLLDAQHILHTAEQQVGISDTDTFVRTNLERLVEALNREAGLSAEGFASAERMLIWDMVNRLEGLKWVQDFPEILDEPIDRPVFLTGLPRSGTTYFQYLFDLDARFRQIRTWEALTPNPPFGGDAQAAQERKSSWAARRQALQPSIPGFAALHLHDEDGSEECHAFMEQSLGAAGLNNIYRVPGYFDYLLHDADLEASYRVHKRQLQLLQWRTERKPWSLKYPNHLLAVDEILRVYPDARLVMTHRDPLQTTASIAKLSYTLRSARSDQPVDMKTVGNDMKLFVKQHIDRIMAAADGPHADRIVHVDYYALVNDPANVMLQVHRQLAIDSPAEVLDAVKTWYEHNPKNARGDNPYNLEQFGLDEDELIELYRDYMRRFNIPREQEGLANPR